jgi:hypothetical protein
MVVQEWASLRDGPEEGPLAFIVHNGRILSWGPPQSLVTILERLGTLIMGDYSDTPPTKNNTDLLLNFYGCVFTS